jgi:hypothetical protein
LTRLTASDGLSFHCLHSPSHFSTAFTGFPCTIFIHRHNVFGYYSNTIILFPSFVLSIPTKQAHNYNHIHIYIYTHIYYIYVYMHTHMYICIKFFVQYTRVISLNWQVHFSADTHITLILLERLLVLFGSSQEIWN